MSSEKYDYTISYDSDALPCCRNSMNMLIKAILKVLDSEGLAFDLVLSGDYELEQYNRKFMNCPGPTNILSFPAEKGSDENEPEEDGEIEPEYGLFSHEDDILIDFSRGQLIMSLETVSREADLYFQDRDMYLARILTHGLLHLLGYDHGPLMDKKNDSVMQAVRAWIKKPGAAPILYS